MPLQESFSLTSGESLVCKISIVSFCSLYALALLIFLVGRFGWFGAERDPLSGVYLIILGQPWIRFAGLLPEALWPAAGVLAPTINAALIFAFCRLVRIH